MTTYTQSFMRGLDSKDPFLSQYVENQEPSYYLGLDLGQAQDYTALIVASLTHKIFNNRLEPACDVPVIARWPLGTSYPAIVSEVAERIGKAPAGTRLILDGTGCGRAVVDLFLCHPFFASRRSYVVPVTITAGDHELFTDGYHRVPKRNLVGSVQALLQSGRLKIAANLAETKTLVTELQNFRVKITTSANDTYEAWRDGMHDDLVLACALAVWGATSPKINAEFKQGEWIR